MRKTSKEEIDALCKIFDAVPSKGYESISEATKTAVEILVEGLIQECGLDDDGNMAKYIIQRAKEMFEQQIKDAYLNGRYDADKIVMTERFYVEQYYNETYGKDNI
jgi:hypothetical protein